MLRDELVAMAMNPAAVMEMAGRPGLEAIECDGCGRYVPLAPPDELH